LDSFFSRYLPDLNLGDDLTKKIFLFIGKTDITGPQDDFFISTMALVIMFAIWECKLQKSVPSLEKIANDVFYD
jgi:hypothetical protein